MESPICDIDIEGHCKMITENRKQNDIEAESLWSSKKRLAKLTVKF